MKYVISYRHTGVPHEQLSDLLLPVRDAFLAKGDDIYCTFFNQDSFQENNMSTRDIIGHAFEKIEEMGTLFVIQDSEARSEGMLIEVGYCIAKNIKVIIATREDIRNTCLPSMADQTIQYKDTPDLVAKIRNLQY